jgi:GT2 family glycosyltransferase
MAVVLGIGAVGAAAALPSIYLAALSMAALASRRLATHPMGAEPSLAVLVPAHDEALLIARCLDSLAEQDYPAARHEVFVVADNCTDDTAAIARSQGASVLERHEPTAPGKGQALRWAIDLLLEQRPDIDAFVVVDADSLVDPGLLSALARAHVHGADVVQADYEALVEGSDPKSQLRAAAFLLFHRVRFTGKANLGLPCALVGNGMLLSREVCQRVPWTAFSEVEDLEYGVTLRLAGIDPVFAADAHLVAPVATAGRAADVQRSRWEGGRARVVRQHLPRLLREVARGRLDLWDAALDLAVPPLGVLAVAVAAGTGTALTLRMAGLVTDPAVAPWLVAAAAVPAHVLIGLRAAGAPPEMTAALSSAPGHVWSEMLVRVGAMRSPAGLWVRTPR